MPQFAVLIYSSRDDRGSDSPPEYREENDRHADDLATSGSMLLAYALTSREYAVAVRSTGTRAGALVEASESVVGFYVLNAPDLSAAVEIASRNPAVAAGGGVEIREVESGGVVSAASEQH